MVTRRGRLVDLFAGAGGLSLGMEQAGFDVAVSADNKPENAATHAINFGYGSSLRLDLTRDRTREIRHALMGQDPDAIALGQSLDAIIGGPPCQGLSIIGKKLTDDPRNALMVRFIDQGAELQARYMVMEQVPALLSPRNAALFDQLREHLRTRGYLLVEPRILRAVDFGVPQRRERVFLLIHREDQPAPAYPLPTHAEEPDFLLHRTPTVSDAFDGLPDADDFDVLWEQDWVRTCHPAPTSRYGRIMRGLANDPEDLSYPRIWDPGLLTCSQRTRHDEASVRRFLATRPGGSEPVSRRHRLDPQGTSLTLRAGSDEMRGSFTSVVPIHPKGSRVITVREAARLHSIPDAFQFGYDGGKLSADHGPRRISKIRALRQIGNSVPPLLARAVGQSIMKALALKPEAPTTPIPIRERKAA